MSPDSNELLDLADRCVKCGICLPGCPTYQVDGKENRSPRGRIAQIEGWQTGQIPDSSELRANLNSCLGCGHCESVCPSKVEYRKLLRLTRGGLGSRLGLLADLLTRPRLAKPLLRLASISAGVAARLMPRFRRQANTLRFRELRQPRLPATAIDQTSAETIGLFLGCIGRLTQASALEAARQLLQATGKSVAIPDNQACCGGLFANLGDADKAHHLAAQNRTAFAGVPIMTGIASGCGAHLAEQTGLPPFRDIHGLLASDPGFAALEFRSLDQRIAVHIPCTLRYPLKGERPMLESLKRIPQLQLVPLPDGCCGAGGLTGVAFPEQAEYLAKPLVDIIIANQCASVVTANPGCAEHIAAALRTAGHEIPVIHTVELLARQLAEH